MNNQIRLPEYPDLKDKVAVITGGGGAIGGAIADALAHQGTRVAIWDISLEAAQRRADEINTKTGKAIGVKSDVTSTSSVTQALEQTESTLGTVDILINGAGGSRRESTTGPELRFFDITADAFAGTLGLNYLGTVLPSQAVGRGFAERGKGAILNIASIAAIKPLTRAIGYSNAKAAVVSFTEWLAVYMAKEFNPCIRVNALAPGFVLTDQNRFLLTNEQTGEPTERCRTIMQHVPMGRLGKPHEMIGAALWLVSDTASFATGITVPIDGGLTAWNGV